MGDYKPKINNKFTELFQRTFGFDDDELNLFFSQFTYRKVFKKEFFLKPGQICKSKAYLSKGCMRNYVLDEKCHERILYFSFEDWWLGDIESYYAQRPSTNYIQALEDCDIFVISKENFDRLTIQIPKLQKWLAVKMVPAVCATNKRMEELKTLSPEERYRVMIEKQPNIFKRVPLQYIAAYLNIEPPSLSRLRRRLAQKD
jgi:CRP-like cAMP-binding protein